MSNMDLTLAGYAVRPLKLRLGCICPDHYNSKQASFDLDPMAGKDHS